MALNFTVNLNIEAAIDAGRDGAERGVGLAAEHILGASNEHVPLEYGDLQSSGVASSDGLTAAVSYDTPYAVYQHEEMGLRHDAGRTAKYLENAVHDEADAAANIIAASIRGEL